MIYKNPKARAKSKFRPLGVACAHCKTPVAVYQKAGTGGLTKMQFPRILEIEMDLSQPQGSLTCPQCGQALAKLGDYEGNPTYWILRGQVNTKWLTRYRY